jgi:phage terminase large subunit-like protein
VHVHGGGLRVLGRVGQHLGDGEVGGDLDLLGQPTLDPHIEANRHRAAASQHSQRRAEAALGESGRVDAAGELPQLADRRARLGGDGIQPRSQLGGLG